MIGTVVSHYVIMEELGRGGMGVVYRARDTKLNRYVALKFLPPEFAGDPDAKKRLIQEAQAASSLDHPNICAIFEIDETESGQLFIAMACYSGMTLKQKMQHDPITSEKAIDIVTQVAQGLAEAHKRGITHRDIKPANIFVTDDGVVKILDFGLAILAGQSRLTKTGSTPGTVVYMSPEQLIGSEIRQQTDIWSLAVVLYEMLTGLLPFRGENEQAVIYSILNTEPEPATGSQPEISRLLDRVFERATAKDTEQRYQNIAEFIRDITPEKESKHLPLREQQVPSFLHEDEEGFAGQRRLAFVAREKELVELQKVFEQTLSGGGRVLFITGEAGDGKTALIQEFSRRSQEIRPDLIVAGGTCNAHTGIGDPYFAFREIISLLSGDVESQCKAGLMSRQHAQRLWNLTPLFVQALVGNSPDLMNTFISGETLVARARQHASGTTRWFSSLKKLAERKSAVPADPMLQQSNLFEQYYLLLQFLSSRRPLLLILDDLQWADVGSINLLFHLGRRIERDRILILGAYRPAEIAIGRSNERHPLESVLQEFKRSFGPIELDISTSEGRHFVDSWLDQESAGISPDFREMLFQQTSGHPLFTIELCRAMQERGMLVSDQTGRWMEGPGVNWNLLPARIDAVINERISRLSPELQKILILASVEGDEFTAEAIAQILKSDVREVIQLLSGEVDKRHHLVNARGVRRLNGRSISVYRFRHFLFHRYLYSTLDEIERVHLHEEVARALEDLYGDRRMEIALKLARHFQEAGLPNKAVGYLVEAGHKAMQLSAVDEAILHFRNGLNLLQSVPASQERTELELNMQLGLVTQLQTSRGYAASEVGQTCAAIKELSCHVGKSPLLFQSLFLLCFYNIIIAEHRAAKELIEQMFEFAGQDELLENLAHYFFGWLTFTMGEFKTAATHLDKMIEFYDPAKHSTMAFSYVQDPGLTCMAFSACVHWCLGYSEQAEKRMRQAVTLAEKLGHPFTLASILAIEGLMNILRRDVQGAFHSAEKIVPLCEEKGFRLFLAVGIFKRGWAMTQEGEVQGGIALLKQALDGYLATGMVFTRVELYTCLAESYGEAGEIDQGLETLDEAVALLEHNGERYFESEVYRMKGELLLKKEKEGAAEECFNHAIEIARRQHARSWHLRAAMSLGRLWKNQGKNAQARGMLQDVYDGFTEGFRTPDLLEAQKMLRTLGNTQRR